MPDHPYEAMQQILEAEMTDALGAKPGERSESCCSSGISALKKALVSALADMYVQGVATRKVKTITEELSRPQLLCFCHKPDHPGGPL